MIYVNPEIEKPYTLDDKSLGEYLKELKQTEKEIEKYDWTFERAGLYNSEFGKKVLNEIKEQIKLCEHYFITKRRKDLFKWDSWSKERDIYSFSNGKVKAIIEVFKGEKSTEIVYKIVSDCKLYLFFRGEETHKNLRNEENIRKYIEEVKSYLEKEVNEVKYHSREQDFYRFILK